MNIVEACFSLGQEVKINFPGTTQHGKKGKLVKVQSHNITQVAQVMTLQEKPLCTVVFDDFLELPFFPRHLDYPSEEQRVLRLNIFANT